MCVEESNLANTKRTVVPLSQSECCPVPVKF